MDITPERLAVALGIDAKKLRAWLREEFPRSTEMKNHPWDLNLAMVVAAVRKFG